MSSETLIGRGATGRVYRIDGTLFARKEFDTAQYAKRISHILYGSTHYLDTEDGQKYSYWKRRLASRLADYHGGRVRINDALDLSYRGFTFKFIDGTRPKFNDMLYMYAAVTDLEQWLNDIGMPTAVFRTNLFWPHNFILQNGTIHTIDYEEGVPWFDARGKINGDIIYFDDVFTFLSENIQSINDILGTEESRYLQEALEMAREHCLRLDLKPNPVLKFLLPVEMNGHKN